MAPNVTHLDDLSAHQADCRLEKLQPANGLTAEEMARLVDITDRKRPMAKGAHLFRQDDPFKSAFIVRAGSLKTYVLTDDGREQVLGFYLPGEVLGLDAISEGYQHANARALETTSVCEIPFEELQDLAGEIPGIQRQLLRIVSQELRTDEKLMTLLASKTAEARLATFLLDMSRRHQAQGHAANSFNLSMSRGDIANHLGLAVETVSRLLTRLQNESVLSVQRKLVQILDPQRLERCAGETPRQGRQTSSA